jgi:hypothetical protein
VSGLDWLSWKANIPSLGRDSLSKRFDSVSTHTPPTPLPFRGPQLPFAKRIDGVLSRLALGRSAGEREPI